MSAPSTKKWTQKEIQDTFPEDLVNSSTEAILQRVKMLENESRIYRNTKNRMKNEVVIMKKKLQENQEKIKQHKKLPLLVANVTEVLDNKLNIDIEDDGATIDLDDVRKGKSCIVKTTTRKQIYLPAVGIVDPNTLKPGDLVGVNRDSYLVLEKLPSDYDSRVKAMMVEEKPKEDYSDIGGLDKQIKEMYEAIVLPMTHSDRFHKIGIQPPKGVLLYGAPGTGKTLVARACAAQTKATFIKLAGTQLVQQYIGDGSKLVRDCFALAKKKAPSIIFIDELDAIGTKRVGEKGTREVQRTMLELLNQLDGFDQVNNVKVIAATNRVDILDPALLRSGRIDRKVEFKLPNENARTKILRIHSRKMNTNKEVNYEELSRCTEDFNGAQLKAVCVEAGMNCLRRDGSELKHNDFMEGINIVKMKKKKSLNYYA